MSRTIKPITRPQCEAADAAVFFLRGAVNALSFADSPRALEKARRALKSAEGARRHAAHRWARRTQ